MPVTTSLCTTQTEAAAKSGTMQVVFAKRVSDPTPKLPGDNIAEIGKIQTKAANIAATDATHLVRS